MNRLLFALFLVCISANASTVTFSWDKLSDPSVTNYNILMGEQSGNYTNVIAVGNVSEATVSNLIGGHTYFFNIRGQTSQGLESDLATEFSGAAPEPPKVVSSPQNVVVPNSHPVSLVVNATGEKLSYQWYKNGEPISGATMNIISFPAATWKENGIYNVVVTNIAGKDISQNSSILVIPPAVTNFKKVGASQ